MDSLSYLAQTEQQLSFIIARERRQGRERCAKKDDSPMGLIKESDIKGGGRRRGEEEEEFVRSCQGPSRRLDWTLL